MHEINLFNSYSIMSSFPSQMEHESVTESLLQKRAAASSPLVNGTAPPAGATNGKVPANTTATNRQISANVATSSSTTGTFMKLKTYLLALRPWSLSASLVPTLLGSALAFRSQWASEFSFITLFLTIFTVVTVHCAGNVVNTYFDFIKGIDKQKADDRTLVDHILTKDEVSNFIFHV